MGSNPSLRSGRSPGGEHDKPTPVFLAGESHEDSSLAGDSPNGHKELDTTEQLSDLGIKPSNDKQNQKVRREARFSGYHARLWVSHT